MNTSKVVDKLWGKEAWLVNDKGANYCIKRMLLNPGYRCSEHYHKVKDETFYVLEGIVRLVVNGEEHILETDDFMRIEPFDIHYFEAVTPNGALFLECSTYHDDNDVVRMTDSKKL